MQPSRILELGTHTFTLPAIVSKMARFKSHNSKLKNLYTQITELSSFLFVSNFLCGPIVTGLL